MPVTNLGLDWKVASCHAEYNAPTEEDKGTIICTSGNRKAKWFPSLRDYIPVWLVMIVQENTEFGYGGALTWKHWRIVKEFPHNDMEEAEKFAEDCREEWEHRFDNFNPWHDG